VSDRHTAQYIAYMVLDIMKQNTGLVVMVGLNAWIGTRIEPSQLISHDCG